MHRLTIPQLYSFTDFNRLNYRTVMQTYPTTDDRLGAALSVGVFLVWLVVVIAGLILEQAP